MGQAKRRKIVFERDPSGARVRAVRAVYEFLSREFAPQDAFTIAVSAAAELAAGHFIGDIDALINEVPATLREVVADFAAHNPDLVARKYGRLQ